MSVIRTSYKQYEPNHSRHYYNKEKQSINNKSTTNPKNEKKKQREEQQPMTIAYLLKLQERQNNAELNCDKSVRTIGDYPMHMLIRAHNNVQ